MKRLDNYAVIIGVERVELCDGRVGLASSMSIEQAEEMKDDAVVMLIASQARENKRLKDALRLEKILVDTLLETLRGNRSEA